MKPHFLLILLFTLFINACSVDNSKELKQVDELSIKVKLLKTTLEDVDMEKVKLAKQTYKDNMLQISKYYQSDTIIYDVANTLNNYKGIKKTGKNIDEKYKDNQENVELLISQLEKLKTDIENNAIVADSIQNFIDFETENVKKLSDNIGTFVVDCAYLIETHDTYAEKVKGFTTAFK